MKPMVLDNDLYIVMIYIAFKGHYLKKIHPNQQAKVFLPTNIDNSTLPFSGERCGP